MRDVAKGKDCPDDVKWMRLRIFVAQASKGFVTRAIPSRESRVLERALAGRAVHTTARHAQLEDG